jgi:hypothetical protein
MAGTNRSITSQSMLPTLLRIGCIPALAELFVQPTRIEHTVDDLRNRPDEPGDEHEQHAGDQAGQIGGDLLDQDFERSGKQEPDRGN